ncbi:MAG: hypothetical protein NTW25_15405 [Candidatus Kapabacteria bacterium]|nr:hypothetical protein [Candidatus Kapabacteria bacterium]
MKKITLILILIIFNVSLGFSQILRPLNYSLVGVLKFQNQLIAYGTGCAYMTSKDNGLNWDEHFIDNYYYEGTNIVKIIEFGNDLIGITYKNTIVQTTFSSNSIELQFNKYKSLFNLVDICSDNQNAYILTEKSIITVNKKFEIIDEFKIPDSLKILTSNKILIKNNIVYFTSNKTQIYSITNKVVSKVIDFVETGDCTTCTINQFLVSNDVFYCGVGDKVKYSNDNCLSFKNTKSYNASYLKVYNNKIYAMISGNINSINRFFVYDILKAEVIFENYYYENFLSLGSVARDFVPISNDTLVAIGYNKFISRTTNQGNTWENVSMFSNIDPSGSLYWINDSIGLYSKSAPEMQRTTNAGKTWQPIQYSNELANSTQLYSRNFLFYPNGKGSIVFDNSIGYPNNIGMSNDFGKSFKLFKKSDSLTQFDNSYHSEYSETQNYLIYENMNIPTDYSALIINDTNFVVKKNIRFKHLNLQKLKIYSDNHFQILGLGYKNQMDFPIIDSLYYLYLETFDKGETFDTIFKFKPFKNDYAPWSISDLKQVDFNSGYFITHKRIDSISNRAMVYSYFKDTLKLIYEEIVSSYARNLYFFNKELHLLVARKDGSHILKMKDGVWIEEYKDSNYIFTSFYQTKNKIFLKGFAIKSNILNVFEYKPSLISSVETQIEDQTYFYSYPPFPIPAKNEVKSLIYWDMSYNIDYSDIGVYDIYGNKIANREKISINKLNAYSGYLSWDCSGAGTGVYMIQIKHGTNTHNIRAMVVR